MSATRQLLSARHLALGLLVPVFGMASSVALLAEPFPTWKAAAMLLVMAGLSLNLLWSRLRARLASA